MTAVLVSLLALESCATLSGLEGKEAVDCPDGCTEGGASAPDAATDRGDAAVDAAVADTGPPACDPAKDVECIPLPVGWSLVARAPLASGAPPACPTGMANASTVEEGPQTRGDTCTCETCSVTASATCSGNLQHSWGDGAGAECNDGATSSAFYKNSVAGTCYTDIPGSWGEAERNRFSLPSPSGGGCSIAPTKNAGRVIYEARALLCDDTSRCSGGFCDGRIDAPFASCVARAGDEACPPGFPQKHVAGTEGADFDCGACSCDVNRAPCQGGVQHFSDVACANLAVTHNANGTCGGPNTRGLRPGSYKVVAMSTTTCTVASNSTTATNLRMKNARTVCCRQ